MKALLRGILWCALLVPGLSHASDVVKPSGVVNITTASAEEFERLPGIGEKKAAAIIEHRRAHPLKRVEDLTHVKGIGRKTVARLRAYLTMNGATTLVDRPSRSTKTAK
jgi:competence ComEA-like helix-hairpin-helix protein